MPKILIQAGHINIEHNCDPAMRGSTGAPNEQDFTIKTANRVSELLRHNGFEVKQTDGNANCDVECTGVDWDLALSIHYDAAVYKTADGTLVGGGFVDYPDPSIDQATAKSQAFAQALRSIYFSETGIVEHPERSNKNTRFYYLWRALSAETPCVIIECGVGMEPNDRTILLDTERIATAIVKGICKGFMREYASPDKPLIPTIESLTQERNELLTKIKEAQEKYDQINAAYSGFVSMGYPTTQELSTTLDKNKSAIEGLQKELTQVLTRNKTLAELVAKKDEEDATALELAVKVQRELDTCKTDLAEVRKACGMPRHVDIQTVIEYLYKARDVVQRLFVKPAQASTPAPVGHATPPLEGQKKDEWNWLKGIGLGVIVFGSFAGTIILFGAH